MPRRWLILADDLTGAADCAIAFARQGMESVATWGEGIRTIAASVLSVNVDSRNLPPRKAATSPNNKGRRKPPIGDQVCASTRRSIRPCAVSPPPNWPHNSRLWPQTVGHRWRW